MKKKSLLMMGLAVLAFSACSNDELLPEGGANGGPAIDSGELTSVTVKVNSGTPSTRVVGSGGADLGGNSDTKTINDFRVLVFDDVTKRLEVNQSVAGATNMSFLVKPGKKQIYVLANIIGASGIDDQLNATAFPPNEVNSTLSYFLGMTYNGSVAGSLTRLVAAAGYVMSSTQEDAGQEAKPNITIDPNNPGTDNVWSFNLYNMASIIGVCYNNADALTLAGKGSFSALKYVVRNIAKTTFFVQRYPKIGCYYDWTPPASTLSEAERWAAGFRIPLFTSAVDIIEKPTPITASSPARRFLMTENINQVPAVGNTTYMAIRATFTPADTVLVTSVSRNEFTGQITYTYVDASNPRDASSTFFTSAKTGLSVPVGMIFNSETVVKQALAMAEYGEDFANHLNEYTEDNNSYKKYTSGYCWYRMNVGTGTSTGGTPDAPAEPHIKNGIERGKSYIATITKIADIGYHDEGVLDGSVGDIYPPGSPLDATTNIRVEITANGWIDTEFEGTLGT